MGYLRLGVITLVCLSGCDMSFGSWYAKHGWKAANHFDDSQVLKLCAAIEAKDLAEVKRLVEAGANVKAIGKGGVTPLVWAFPEADKEIFTFLLKSGADPNVKLTEKLDPFGNTGDSVTTKAAESRFDLFDVVMEHGGDPNITESSGDPLLHVIISGYGPDKNNRVKTAIASGADLDRVKFDSPLFRAIGWGGQYDVAMTLILGGAKIDQLNENSYMRPIDGLADEIDRPKTPKQSEDFRRLIEAFESRGESLDAAIAKRQRIKDLAPSSPYMIQKVFAEELERAKQEVAERRRKEALKKNPGE